MTVMIALDQNARALMKRDMELVRSILLEIQSRADLKPKLVEIGGADDVAVGRHVEMLHDAGLIDGIAHRTATGKINYKQVLVTDMTWDGHDFLAALDDQSVWSKIKAEFSAAELASMPLSVMKDVGLGLLKAYAMQRVGITPS